ncbi:hypothetical protein VKT23_011532 [Stygiomarasmius scandens]|uniref:Ricin B lectin domain-containing protein n=1 Tax=Marasmiellus scandens TaxID=2682957 RepID=A0ABR1J9A2_9AGAR
MCCITPQTAHSSLTTTNIRTFTMALLLVPYNETMYLGMGFNSFTQQTCVDDAVKLSGGKEAATEQALHPQYKDPITNNNDVNIPHEITWNAKFVDHISEVTDGLNVGAALYIRCGATSIGETTPAYFFDPRKFTESDVNYWIQVKVTTQRLTCPGLTEFSPIKNIPQSEFTRVYGDSFISGFTEGGEFNAVISIKLRDNSQVKAVREQLKAGLDFKAASAQGEGNVENRIDGEMTIAISRRGGGDIKDEKVEQWTLQTLNAAAMEFPQKAVAYPIRTNAILTKYTSLKSFRTTNPVGTLLDYRNAGIYPSTLLDAYMDYKVMLCSILTTISEVERGNSELIARDNMAELAELNREAKEYYQHELNLHKRAIPEERISSDTTAYEASSEHSWPWASIGQKDVPLPSSILVNASSIGSKPSVPNNQINVAVATSFLPEVLRLPNDLVPYKANIFGLEKARRDCRFEMVKIVREVDAVAEDPRVASDPCRTAWQYLNPSVFRMLLPTVKNVDKERITKETMLAMEASTRMQEQLHNDLNELKKTLEETKEKLRVKEQAINELACPVPLDTPIRFRSYTAGKCLDLWWSNGNGNLSLHIWDSLKDPNQQWIISRAGAFGFFIRHQDSGRYLSTGSAGPDGRVYLTTHEFGNIFTFEQQDNDTVWIHLADSKRLTMNLEGANRKNGTKITMSPHTKGDNDKWYVKRFEDSE